MLLTVWLKPADLARFFCRSSHEIAVKRFFAVFFSSLSFPCSFFRDYSSLEFLLSCACGHWNSLMEKVKESGSDGLDAELLLLSNLFLLILTSTSPFSYQIWTCATFFYSRKLSFHCSLLYLVWLVLVEVRYS